MKHTLSPLRRNPRAALTLGLLGAVSAAALFAIADPLVANTDGAYAGSGGYATSGVPVGAGGYPQGGALNPTAVGPAAVAGDPAPNGLGHVPRGRWKTSVTPFVEGTVTHSDNINLAPKGFEEDETVLTATAGVTLTAQSERLSGALSYAASYDTYLNETNADGFRHDLNTSWGAAVIPNLLYFDAAGGVSESYIDVDDRFSANAVAGAGDRSRVYYGSLSPSLRRNLGGWANAELRYILRGQKYDDSAYNGNYSHTYRAALSSDPRTFRSFGWAVATEYEDFRLEEDDGLDRTRWSSQVSVDVPISRAVAVTGSAGYDQFGDVAVSDDLDGAWANAGLRFTPNQRFNAQAYGGWRYGGVDYGGQLSYVLANRAVAAVSAGRTVQFAEGDRAPVQVFGAGTGSDGQPLYRTPDGGLTSNLSEALAQDLLSGEFGVIGDPDFARQRDDAVVDTLTASLSGTAGRTSYGISGTGLKRDYGGTFENETVVSASLNLAHNFTDRLAGDAGIGWSRVDLEDSDANDFDSLAAGVGLSYQLTEIINVFGRYTYSQRFADTAADEFKENAGVLGVRASF